MDDLFCSRMVSLKMCVFTLILERVGGEVYLLLNVINEQPCVFMWLPILCCTTSDKIEPKTSLFLLETWWTTKNSTLTMTGMINEPEVAMAEDHPGRRIKKKCPYLYTSGSQK